MKPLIALNCEIDTTGKGKVRVNRTYVEAIQRSGGIPFPVAPMPNRDLIQVLRMVSGLVFIGGNDYSPSSYGEEPHATVKLINPVREEFDRRLMALALRAMDETGEAKPIVGVCGGMQLLNIVSGGSLTQDIESSRPGRGIVHRDEDGPARHPVKLVSGSQLARIYRAGTVERPISSHHQAVNRLGRNLTVTGFAEDGIIEAIEHVSRPFTLGVQWHPEADYDGSMSALLFEALVRRARKMRLVA